LHAVDGARGTSTGGVYLAVVTWSWTRMSGGRQAGFQTLAVRLAGALLVFGSGFALGKDLWHQVASYCGF